MLTIVKLQEILNANLDLNHYVLLTMIIDNQPVEKVDDVKVKGWLKMMLMKGLIEKHNEIYKITEQGLSVALLQPRKLLLTDVMKVGYDYENLQKILKEELKRLTGYSQYFIKVQGTNYPYIPSVLDLKTKIEKFKMVYKMTDMEKIEKCLLRHLSIRNQKLVYYIIREKGDSKSDLAADYENFNELREIKTVIVNKTTDI